MQKSKYIVHCLNSSPSKEAHKFGKSERFEMRKSYGQFKYHPKQVQTKISPSFGYGNKGQYIRQTKTPSPDKYRLRSQFDNKNKGYSFGKSPSTIKKAKENRERTMESSNKYIKIREQTDKTKTLKSTHEKLKTQLMNLTTTLDRRYGERELQKSLTPTKRIPGPGAYNLFSEFGPLNYYR